MVNAPATGRPIRGVIFDLHATLVHAGEPTVWLEAALALLGSEGEPRPDVPDPAEFTAWAPNIWSYAREVDPASARDLSPQRHREVYDAMIERTGLLPAALADALYQTMLDQWEAFDEAVPVLTELSARGVRTALLSNIGIDPRAVLRRTGLTGLFDVMVLSYEEGVVKPDPAIFALTAQRMGLPPEDVLMVGDSVEDDAGGGHLGMRTLLLPRTAAPTHGLEQVLRLVG